MLGALVELRLDGPRAAVVEMLEPPGNWMLPVPELEKIREEL